MKQRLQNFMGSPIFSISMGLLVFCAGLYDVYDEVFEIGHEHVLMIFGLLIIITSLNNAHEGFHQFISGVSKKDSPTFFSRFDAFMNKREVRIIIGIIILIASAYGLFQDISKIWTKGLSMSVGLIMVILSSLGAKQGIDKISNKTKTP